MRIVKWILGIAFVAGLIAAFVIASLPKPAIVEVTVVEQGHLASTVDGDGRTRVKDRYTILAPLYGNLARIELDPGDEVAVGQTIARVSPLRAPLLNAQSRTELDARVKASKASRQQALAALARANEALEFAERDYARAEQLARSGGLTSAALDAAELERRQATTQVESAKFGVQVATHEVAMARAALGHAGDDASSNDETSFDIASPVNGRVLRIIRHNEGVVNPGEQLVEVGDPNALEIVVDVLTQDAVLIEHGAKTRIERWGGAHPLLGKVQRVEPSAFTKISALGVEEQRVNVVVAFDDMHAVPRNLGDGFHVDVAIHTWESDHATYVPVGAIHRKGDAWAAFLVDGNLVAERTIEIGHRGGVNVEVVSGLEPGAIVVMHPSDLIRDGVEVEIAHADAENADAS